MKEIGDKLRETRESIGVSLEEAATDLKTTTRQLQNIEDGNMEAFKDVVDLKYLIRDYAKYLGLDKDDMVDEFNEYIFDYTSKISLEDITNAKAKNKESKKDEKVKSPYTTIPSDKRFNFVFLLLMLIVILGVIVVSVYYININRKKETNVITYNERR